MLSKKQQLNWNKKPKGKRVSKQELKQRVEFILNKKVCQVCEWSKDLDYPHHAVFGLGKKDDRTLINICVDCHRHIHTKGFPVNGKSREDTVKIGWANNKEFLSETK